MKIVITGGAGFIGSHLVDALIERGHSLLCLDNLSTGSIDNISHHHDSWLFLFDQCDICDREKINTLIANFCPDVVYHLAAMINVRHCMTDPETCFRVNVEGGMNVISAMILSWCKRMIFSSTGGAMFSDWLPPYDEEKEAHPDSPYGISKKTFESLLSFYEKQYSIRSTILRYANVYWSRQNALGEAGVISIFCDAIRKNMSPTIYSDGFQTRDFIHVSDVVSANIHALEQDLMGIYHVWTGRETSINTLWHTLADSQACHVQPMYKDALGEIVRTSLNPRKLLDTGWAITKDISTVSVDML